MNAKDYLYEKHLQTDEVEPDDLSEPEDPIFDFDVTPYGWGMQESWEKNERNLTGNFEKDVV